MVKFLTHPVFRILLAVIAGIALLFIVQMSLVALWKTVGIRWSNAELPLAPGQQVAALSTLFAAIFVSTLGAAWIAGDRAVFALLILVTIGVGIDGFAMFVKIGEALPLWFRIAFVAQIPLATLVGWIVVRPWLSRSRNRSEGEYRAH